MTSMYTTMRGMGPVPSRVRSTSHTSYYTQPVMTQPLTQQHTLHPATYTTSYANFQAYQPTYDASMMMYPSYTTYQPTTYSTFAMSQPLPIAQHISQPLQQQQLALLMQHAWMQQASCFQSQSQSQSQPQPQPSLYPSVCFPSTTYYPPVTLPVVPPVAPAPVLPTVHAHMQTHDPTWILAHPSPSESTRSSASSSRTCSPTYHLPCTCTGCHGTCTCSHMHAPQSCTSQASIGTSVESIPHPKSYSPPQLMLPPIMIPPSTNEVHSATIHRARGHDDDTDDTTSALASTHISDDMPPLSLTTSTSCSSLSSYGSVRNNFETPLMIIDDDEESPKHGRHRAMTVMGMMMAASQRSATTPHPSRPRRLSQRMSILRPMAMSQPVSPQPSTRDVEAEIAHDNATSTISSSFEPPTSLSMSLSPLHPMEWPSDKYACEDEYDKVSYDFTSQRVNYDLPKQPPPTTFSYADVVRSKQPIKSRSVTRVPHSVSRA